jgi:hypothetical protein
MVDVGGHAGEEVVEAEVLMSVLDQPVAQMTAEKSCAALDYYPRHVCLSPVD